MIMALKMTADNIAEPGVLREMLTRFSSRNVQQTSREMAKFWPHRLAMEKVVRAPGHHNWLADFRTISSTWWDSNPGPPGCPRLPAWVRFNGTPTLPGPGAGAVRWCRLGHGHQFFPSSFRADDAISLLGVAWAKSHRLRFARDRGGRWRELSPVIMTGANAIARNWRSFLDPPFTWSLR